MSELILPEGVTREFGKGGLVKTIAALPSGARLEAYDQGAHITYWQPSRKLPNVLYLSANSQFEHGQPIRGGIPQCAPHFGNGPQGNHSPKHGRFRLEEWELVKAVSEDGAMVLTWELRSNADEELAGNIYRAELTVSLRTGALTVAPLVYNLGTAPIFLEHMLHPYFAVHSVTNVEVYGFDQHSYRDSVTGQTHGAAHAAVRIPGHDEICRVYEGLAEAAVYGIRLATDRTLTIRTAGAQTGVVWNPGAQVCKGISDMGSDDYRHFVCVEHGLARSNAMNILPGKSAGYMVTYQV
jgi:glucose-6-phosphate 1-epimerase